MGAPMINQNDADSFAVIRSKLQHPPKCFEYLIVAMENSPFRSMIFPARTSIYSLRMPEGIVNPENCHVNLETMTIILLHRGPNSVEPFLRWKEGRASRYHDTILQWWFLKMNGDFISWNMWPTIGWNWMNISYPTCLMGLSPENFNNLHPNSQPACDLWSHVLHPTQHGTISHCPVQCCCLSTLNARYPRWRNAPPLGVTIALSPPLGVTQTIISNGGL